ncbi:MAG: prolyl oligopeptidase family serine peptidase [Phycisphaerae bacterium]|nr:prolyl oligopeptidase family serine peptidase [Phycisphaerae bacterium]
MATRAIMTKKNLIGLAVCLGLMGYSTMAAELSKAAGQSEQTFSKKITKKFECKYLLYLPADYERDAKKKWPVIMFLHGIGERGNNLQLVKKHGPPKLIEQGKNFDFIIVSPQCPDDIWWTEQTDVLITLLDEIEAKYRVDTDRIYLTGLSMGGFGTWSLAISYPNRFAAIAPVCGGGNKHMAQRLKNVPVWAFHGDKDDAVLVEESKEMVKAVNAKGGNAKLTIYPGAKHDSWTETYDNPQLYEWFLSHKRSDSTK